MLMIFIDIYSIGLVIVIFLQLFHMCGLFYNRNFPYCWKPSKIITNFYDDDSELPIVGDDSGQEYDSDGLETGNRRRARGQRKFSQQVYENEEERKEIEKLTNSNYWFCCNKVLELDVNNPPVNKKLQPYKPAAYNYLPNNQN